MKKKIIKQISQLLLQEIILTENVSDKIRIVRDIVNSDDIEILLNEESIKTLRSIYEEDSDVVRDYILETMTNIYDNSNFSDQVRIAKAHKFFGDFLEKKGVILDKFEGKTFERMSGDYTGVEFINCDFTEADIAGANFQESTFIDCNFIGVENYDKAYLWEISIMGGRFPRDWHDIRSKNYEYPDEDFERDPRLQDMPDTRTLQAQLDQIRRRR